MRGLIVFFLPLFFFSSRRRHTRWTGDWSSDVCSSDLPAWNADATYIQVDAVPSRVGWHVPAEIPIVGDPKLVLRQLSELAAADRVERRGGAWLAEVADRKSVV